MARRGFADHTLLFEMLVVEVFEETLGRLFVNTATDDDDATQKASVRLQQWPNSKALLAAARDTADTLMHQRRRLCSVRVCVCVPSPNTCRVSPVPPPGPWAI